jgi:hypothetical protein
MKRKGKERHDGAKHYTGHPETAHMHVTHHVIPNRRSRRDADRVPTHRRS